jgi:hypothetical protein
MAANYFEQLLGKIEDQTLRDEFKGLSAKIPDIDKWIVDPDIQNRVNTVESWYADNWDPDAGMPKAERIQRERIAQQEQELERLRTQLTTAKGNEMNTDQLEKYLSEKGLISKSDMEKTLKEKEDGFSRILDMVSSTATRVPYLNSKYKDEFGEYFDPDKFLEEATKAKATNLDSFYEREYVAERRQKLMAEKHQKEVEEARLAGKREGLQERVAQEGQMPTLDGSPDLGHFQMRVMGGQKENTSPVPADAELGRGQIARIMAREGDAKALQGRVN